MMSTNLLPDEAVEQICMIMQDNKLESKYGRSNNRPFRFVTTLDEGGSIIGIDNVGDTLSQLSSTLLFFLSRSFILCILDLAEMFALPSERVNLSLVIDEEDFIEDCATLP